MTTAKTFWKALFPVGYYAFTLCIPLAVVAASGEAFAQAAGADPVTRLPEVDVKPGGAPTAYAALPVYKPAAVDVGPLGAQPLQDTPHSIDIVPEDLLVNQQVRTVNDALRYLPSVQVRDQQGLEVSRPQSRGFQGSIVENTRQDGLNIVGTTAIAAEGLSGIEVLNGPAGALFGPETPAGVFNYLAKKPTDVPVFRYIEGFDSQSVFTEQIDAGGHLGPENRIGYRVNLVHGQGESWVDSSYVNRTLLSGDLDYHFDNNTVFDINISHYATDVTGLPGATVFAGQLANQIINGKPSTNTLLPAAFDPTKVGIGQPGAGASLLTNTGEGKFKRAFGDGWTIEVGGLYQDAVRNLFGITNNLTDNNGDYQTTKNFAAIPHYTIISNEASLNGHFTLFGFLNDATFATNGFVWRSLSYRNGTAPVPGGLTFTPNLGTASFADPEIFPQKPTGFNGGQYESGYVSNQSIITGDTLHLTDRLAIQSVLNTSFLKSRGFSLSPTSRTSVENSADTENGVLSPTESVIYKVTPKLTTYFTFASSIEQGDTAPTTAVNSNQILAPYHDLLYETGLKYALFDDFLVTFDGFRETRPYANATTSTNPFEVIGDQRNYGVELFGQGNITPELSVIGGVTYLDPRLQNTGNVSTNNQLIVGTPHWKSDVAADYHPDVFHGAALTAAFHYESSRAGTDTNNTFAPQFSTVDVGARYSTKFQGHFATARFQVLNVTNTYYFSSIADGNSIVGSSGANTAYSGAPRVFQASLEVDF